MALVHLVMLAVICPSHNSDSIGGAVAPDRKPARQSCRFDTRQACGTSHNFTVKLDRLLARRINRAGYGDFCGCKMICVKSERHVQKAIKAPSQQSRTCKKHD